MGIKGESSRDQLVFENIRYNNRKMTEKRTRNGFVHPGPVLSPKTQATRQHNVSRKTTYVFGKEDLAEMSNDNEEIEMTRISHRKPRGRKKSSKTDKEHYVIKEEPIQEGDTLRSFALRYNNQVIVIIIVLSMIRVDVNRYQKLRG